MFEKRQDVIRHMAVAGTGWSGLASALLNLTETAPANANGRIQPRISLAATHATQRLERRMSLGPARAEEGRTSRSDSNERPAAHPHKSVTDRRPAAP